MPSAQWRSVNVVGDGGWQASGVGWVSAILHQAAHRLGHPGPRDRLSDRRSRCSGSPSPVVTGPEATCHAGAGSCVRPQQTPSFLAGLRGRLRMERRRESWCVEGLRGPRPSRALSSVSATTFKEQLRVSGEESG